MWLYAQGYESRVNLPPFGFSGHWYGHKLGDEITAKFQVSQYYVGTSDNVNEFKWIHVRTAQTLSEARLRLREGMVGLFTSLPEPPLNPPCFHCQKR